MKLDPGNSPLERGGCCAAGVCPILQLFDKIESTIYNLELNKRLDNEK
jgi:hypothetical protein